MVPTEEDWEPARAFFEQRKVRRSDLSGAGDWAGWDAEFSTTDSEILKTNPAIHLPHMLRILGPSSLTLYKHVLGRRRILIYTAPPVEAACLLCHVAADLCLEDQIYGEGVDGIPDRPKAQSKEGIKVLGVVTLNDLDRLEQESQSSRGWIACTTDTIFLEKASRYDLLIDLTASGANKATRPAFYMSKPIEPARERQPTHKLSFVRFTWSDVKLVSLDFETSPHCVLNNLQWTELYRLTQLDCGHDSPCCDPSHSNIEGKSKPNAISPWTDIWRVYEDVCVLCAGLWMGNWRAVSASAYPPADENWGSIRLEGEDYLDVVRNENRSSSIPYVRNVGMGIEGRPAGPSSDSGLQHRKTQRRTSAMSMWTWASGKSQGSVLKNLAADEDGQDADIATRKLERQIAITLSLLQAFHTNTSTLLGQLLTFIPASRPSSSSKPKPPLILTPKDIMSFELGPLSSLDHRFVEWLAEEYGDGAKVVVRKGWRDLMGLVVGFG